MLKCHIILGIPCNDQSVHEPELVGLSQPWSHVIWLVLQDSNVKIESFLQNKVRNGIIGGQRC